MAKVSSPDSRSKGKYFESCVKFDLKAPVLSESALRILQNLSSDFSVRDAVRVKSTEKVTNHDVKAVEYFLKEYLGGSPETEVLKEFVHLCCTSEDINNLAYARMLRDSLGEVIYPRLESFLKSLSDFALETADAPLLALTHGQAATPTTFGREIAVFVHRLKGQLEILKGIKIRGKFNGATGSFNAHVVAYPTVDWQTVARDFVQDSIGIMYQPMSTQIECHDYIGEISDALGRISTILIGFSRDMWGYISRHVLKLRLVAEEVGSSTMPHKVNPIDFENAEGNLGLCVSLLKFFSEKLLISRYQRDLSDSTVLRNLGSAFGHFLIALDSLGKGLGKVSVNRTVCESEFEANWSVIGEAVQTVMRKHGLDRPYERLKQFTRGVEISRDSMGEFIKSLAGELPRDEVDKLLALTPSKYLGLGPAMTRKYGRFP